MTLVNFQTLSFKSTSMEKLDAKNYKLTGNLTMHGVTKPVVLNVKLNGTGINPMSKKPVAGFKITGTVNEQILVLVQERQVQL